MKLLSIAAATALAAFSVVGAETKATSKAAAIPPPEFRQLDAAQSYALTHAVKEAQDSQKQLNEIVASIEKQCGGRIQPGPSGFVCVVQPKADPKK